jgi:hypothetical protein
MTISPSGVLSIRTAGFVSRKRDTPLWKASPPTRTRASRAVLRQRHDWHKPIISRPSYRLKLPLKPRPFMFP